MDYLAIARHAILDLGSEDYYHLADAAAYLPTVPEQLRKPVAREAMLQLVDEGLVELFHGQLATNDMSPVPRDRVLAVLDDPSAWAGERDSDGRAYGFANTDRGDELCYSGATQAS
jgi:hypothetical protein